MRRWLAILAVLAACDAGTAVTVHKASPVQHKEPARRLYVLDTVGFTRVDPPGVAPGFDLYGKVSGADDAGSCNKADFTSPDGVPGIDNQFATLVPIIEKTGIAAVEKLLQASIESGGILLGIELDGLDDDVDDPQVRVRLRAGWGQPLLGTDGKLLTDQTFHVSPRDPAVDAGTYALKGGVLEAGPFDVDLPVQVFGNDYTLAARGARLRFRLVDAERVEAGLLGAGITLESLGKIANTASKDQPEIAGIVHDLLDGMGDLAPDAKGQCAQISAVLAFTGVQGFFFPAEWTATTVP